MKQILLKTWLVMLMMCVGVGAWAETRTENFSSSAATTDNYNCASSLGTETNREDFDYTWSIDGSGTVFKSGIKLGSGSATGSVTSSDILKDIPAGTSITVKVYGAVWNTDGGKITVTYNGSSETLDAANTAITSTASAYSSSAFTSSTNFTITKATDVEDLTIASSAKRIIIDKVEVVFENAADTRTAVNITAFSATETTIVKNNTTTTIVTNDQNGWTPSYTYTSSNTEVATVNESGVITAVAKGSATITAALNIAKDDANWKEGTTTSMNVKVTVVNPEHTAHFSVNGRVNDGDDCVAREDDAIIFPSDPADIYGKKFQGWTKTAGYSNATTAPSDLCVSANMGNSDVTYCAVFADVEVGEDIPTTFYYEPFTGSANSKGFTSTNVAATQNMFYDKSATVWSHYTDTKAPSTTAYATNLDGSDMSNGVKVYKQINNTTATILEVKGIDIRKAKNLNVSLYNRRSYTNATLSVEYKIDDAENYTATGGTIVYNSTNDKWKFSDGLSVSGTGSTLDLKVSVKVTGTTNRTMLIDDIKVYGDLSGTTYSNYCTTVAAPVPTYASLDELIDANLEEPTVVNVTLTDEEVTMAMTHPMLPGMYIVVLNDGMATIAAPGVDRGWTQGGTVSGTLENVTWVPEEHSLTSEEGETFWASLKYTAPAGGPKETITLNPACHDEDGFVYTTYSSANAFYAPAEDLIIYEVKVDGGEIALEPYEPDDLVPAYTGVLVCAMEGGDYEVEIETDYDKWDLAKSVLGEANALRPTCIPDFTADDMAAEDPGCEFFRLTMHNGTKIGFWWGAEDGAAFDIAANKAYLAVDKDNLGHGAGVKESLWFGDKATSIKNIANGKQNKVVFNLNGQRVSKTQKGLYITNGKKYMVK